MQDETRPPRPFSQACENNKHAILEILARYLVGPLRVLEIGSGTGQHAAWFCQRLPALRWQCSDLEVDQAGIQAWLDDAGRADLPRPVDLDVRLSPWPVEEVDAVFSANTAHIMGWDTVQAFVAGVGSVLVPGGLFLLYGPFNYEGTYTSESNRRFDAWLAARDPASAIRDFEQVDAAAARAGLVPVEDCGMPANNRLLVWRKR